MSGANPRSYRPLISVILPTFNRAASLEAAINSVLNQTCPDFELIVVDDASTDGTPALLESIHDRRVHPLRLSQRQGAAGARNAGFRESTAELIAFQDSDDCWSPEKLAIQIEHLQRTRPTTGVIYSSFRWQRGANHGLTPSRPRQFLSRIGLARHRLQGDLRRALLQGNFISTQTALVKRECLEKAGGFDERLERLQDWDLWLRIARHYEFHYIELPLVNTFGSSDSISSSHSALILSFDLILEKYTNQPDAYRQIAAQRHYALGKHYLNENQLSAARRQFALALRKRPLTAAFWPPWLASLYDSGIHRRFQSLWKPEE